LRVTWRRNFQERHCLLLRKGFVNFMAAPKLQRISGEDPPILGVLHTGIAQIRITLGASGALIALQDQQQIRLLATAGHVPALGSTLHLNSQFTRECLETGRMLLCDDALADPRISVSAARFLRLRSAIAVPVRWHGSSIGVIQLFSSQVSSFHGAHIDTLQEVSRLFAPILWSESQRLSNTILAHLVVDQPSALPEIVEPQGKMLEPEPPPLELAPPAASAPPSASIPQKALPWLPALARLRYLLWQSIGNRAVLLGAAGFSAVVLLFALVGSVPRGATNRAHSMSSNKRDANVTSATKLDVLPSSRTPTAQRDTSPQEDSPAAVPSSPSMVISEPQKTSSADSEPAPSITSASLHQNAADSATLSPQSSANTLPSSADRTSASPSPSVHFPVAADSVPSPASSSPAPSEVPRESESAPLPTASTTIDTLPTSSATPALLRSTTSTHPNFALAQTVKGHSGWVTGVAFTSDGKRLVSGSWDRTVKLWDVSTAAEVSTMGGESKQVEALAFSRDGRWLAAENSSDNVTIWDASTGQFSRVFPTDKRLAAVGSNWVYSIAFSPDGRLLAAAADDRTIRLWDVKTGTVVRDLASHRRPVIYVAFSPDGRCLASGDDEKTILIWNVSTGEPVRKLTGHKKVVYAVAFSPDGRWLASASADKTIKLWDVELGSEVHTLTGHNGMVTSLAFSPDGRWLASGSWDKTIRIWDVQTGSDVQTLGGQHHSVYAVAFDPRGRNLAAGAEDGTISFWRWKSP
jgi:WD40 repeat protein